MPEPPTPWRLDRHRSTPDLGTAVRTGDARLCYGSRTSSSRGPGEVNGLERAALQLDLPFGVRARDL